MTGRQAYFRATEIADLTGLSLRTIRRWIAHQILPSTKIGGVRLVAISDLQALLAASEESYSEASELPRIMGHHSSDP
jgi:excisionase family DNA binding protein